jgi:hypothetical protein
MLKIKISEFSLQPPPSGGSFSELELKSYVIKQDKGDSTTSPETIKEEYLVLMSETEYREKIASKSGRKSNPLMMNFEEYSE